MQQDQPQSEPIKLTTELVKSEGVLFDPENITLEGSYPDELSAYRARRLWIEALENNFLLEQNYDFKIDVSYSDETELFTITCLFQTACGRYAFWRLTNRQAPEVQYLIETAHIPLCESRHEEILTAPDMRSIYERSALFSQHLSTSCRYENISLFQRIIEALKKLS